MKMKIGYDVMGNVVVLKFDKDAGERAKKVIAMKFLQDHKNVRTALEKMEKFSGRLRTQKTRYLAGEKTKEVLYKENNCIFRFNVDSCYFSPRLSEERKRIASKAGKFERVLVMFGGVGVYGIVIAKNKKVARVVSVELGRECNKYARINVRRNKLENVVELIQGDVRRKVSLLKEKFDRIVMPRPNLNDGFLDVAFSKIKKEGVIHYYGFSRKSDNGFDKFENRDGDNSNKKLSKGLEERDINELRELILNEAKKAGKKIKISGIKKAGDIAPYKFRYRADIKIL